MTPTTADGILNFDSLDSVLKLFHQAELLSTIENLVFDFVTWYVPDQYGHSNEGKDSKMELIFYNVIIKVVVMLTSFIESACVRVCLWFYLKAQIFLIFENISVTDSGIFVCRHLYNIL